jgi:hypothetical protein
MLCYAAVYFRIYILYVDNSCYNKRYCPMMISPLCKGSWILACYYVWPGTARALDLAETGLTLCAKIMRAEGLLKTISFFVLPLGLLVQLLWGQSSMHKKMQTWSSSIHLLQYVVASL